MSKNDQIAQFLATRGATVCPPTSSHKDNARSLRHLRRDMERKCDPLSDIDTDGEDMEDDLREREAFGAARMNGASMSDALDDARMASFNRR